MLLIDTYFNSKNIDLTSFDLIKRNRLVDGTYSIKVYVVWMYGVFELAQLMRINGSKLVCSVNGVLFVKLLER